MRSKIQFLQAVAKVAYDGRSDLPHSGQLCKKNVQPNFFQLNFFFMFYIFKGFIFDFQSNNYAALWLD